MQFLSKYIITISIFMFMFLGCNSMVLEKKIILEDNITVLIKFYDLKYNKDNDVTFIYGKLSIESDVKIKTINLNCLKLIYLSKVSDQIYIDSVAYILTEPYSINDYSLNENVYWTFKGDITYVKLENFNIKISGCSISKLSITPQ